MTMTCFINGFADSSITKYLQNGAYFKKLQGIILEKEKGLWVQIISARRKFHILAIESHSYRIAI
jgi:hypothetical protein